MPLSAVQQYQQRLQQQQQLFQQQQMAAAAQYQQRLQQQQQLQQQMAAAVVGASAATAQSAAATTATTTATTATKMPKSTITTTAKSTTATTPKMSRNDNRKRKRQQEREQQLQKLQQQEGKESINNLPDKFQFFLRNNEIQQTLQELVQFVVQNPEHIFFTMNNTSAITATTHANADDNDDDDVTDNMNNLLEPFKALVKDVTDNIQKYNDAEVKADAINERRERILKSHKRETWDHWFGKLKQYKKKKFGDDDSTSFYIPSSHENFTVDEQRLANWAHNMRCLKKKIDDSNGTIKEKGPLTVDRISKLNSVHFMWSNPKRNVWEQRYEQLKQYYNDHGHSNVPPSLQPLSNWAHSQRKEYSRVQRGMKTRYHKFDVERIPLLNEIEFEWNRASGQRGRHNNSNKKKKPPPPSSSSSNDSDDDGSGNYTYNNHNIAAEAVTTITTNGWRL